MSDIPNAPLKESDRPGYEYDPYGRKDGDGYDQYTDIHPPWIPYHNYRQIHVTECAFFAGYNYTAPGLPECPPLWGDVAHYWNTGAYAGKNWFEVEPPQLAKKALFAGVAGIVYLFLHSHGILV